jgi:hypothetical protein
MFVKRVLSNKIHSTVLVGIIFLTNFSEILYSTIIAVKEEIL